MKSRNQIIKYYMAYFSVYHPDRKVKQCTTDKIIFSVSLKALVAKGIHHDSTENMKTFNWNNVFLCVFVLKNTLKLRLLRRNSLKIFSIKTRKMSALTSDLRWCTNAMPSDVENRIFFLVFRLHNILYVMTAFVLFFLSI